MKYFILLLALLFGVIVANAEQQVGFSGNYDGGSIYKDGYVHQSIGYKVYQKIHKAKKQLVKKFYDFQRYYVGKQIHKFRVLKKKVKKFINRKTRR